MHRRLSGCIGAVMTGLAGSRSHALMPESGGGPASGTVAGIAVQRSWNMGNGFCISIYTAASTVACGAIARRAAENSLHMAGFAARLDMAAGKRETSGVVIELDGMRRAGLILGKAEPAAKPEQCNQHHEDLDRAA